jgi:hypothetical protein
MIDEKLNNSRFPAEKHVGEWNGFNLGTARNEQFHQIEPLLVNGICQSPIFRLLSRAARSIR